MFHTDLSLIIFLLQRNASLHLASYVNEFSWYLVNVYTNNALIIFLLEIR